MDHHRSRSAASGIAGSPKNMNRFPPEPGEAVDLLLERMEALRTELRGRSPASLAIQTGARYDPSEAGPGALWMPLWGKPVRLGLPELVAIDPETGQALDSVLQALLIYHLHTADGTPLMNHWIAFSELPDGRFYSAAFQGYTGNKLAGVFGNDLQGFADAADRLGAMAVDLGDCARGFRVLPRVHVAVVGWQGDEELAPSYRLLFDSCTRHHLPTDACAVLGSLLTGRLLRAAKGIPK